VSIFSIDSLLLAQIDNAGQSYSAFNSATLGEIKIIDENLVDNRSDTYTNRIEVYNLYGSADGLTKQHMTQNGTYQISVFVEHDTGKGDIQKVCQEIIDSYQQVTTGEPDLNIDTISLTTPTVEDKFYRVDVSINYFHYNQFA
jgi:hypothetical protein